MSNPALPYALIAVLGLSAVACAHSEQNATPHPAAHIADSAKAEGTAATATAATAASTGASRSASAAAGITPLGSPNTERKTERLQAPAELQVYDIRIGRHEEFDRVVFEFRGTGLPGWLVDYTDNPTQQASGKPITIAGTSILNVNIDGTVYPFEGDGTEAQAPKPPLGSGITEVVSSGTFEGRSQFFIGLDHGRTPYSVTLLPDPTRVVLDISNHE